MSSHHLDIQNLMDQTGLNRKTIDGCYDLMPAIFGETRRDAVGRNKKLYDSNALVLLQRVRAMRDEGKHLPEIKLILEEELVDDVGKKNESEGEEQKSTVDEKEGGLQGQQQEHVSRDVLEILLQSHKQVVEEKDRTIATKDEVIRSIEDRILLLDEGRVDINSVRQERERLNELVQEQEEKAEQRKQLISALKEASGLGKRKVRQQILTDLEQLD